MLKPLVRAINRWSITSFDILANTSRKMRVFDYISLIRRKLAWPKSAGNVQLFVLLGMMEVRSRVLRGLSEKKSTSWHSVDQISKRIFTSTQIAFTFVRMNCFSMVLKCIRSSAWILGVGGLKILVILALTPFVLLKVSRCSSRASVLNLWISCAVHGIHVCRE